MSYLLPGLCVRHLRNGGNRVQATTKVNGVELCEPCSKARDVVEKVATQVKGTDGTLAGRRFHKHARNCPWCLKTLTADEGTPEASPLTLCPKGKELMVAAYVEAREAHVGLR